MAKYLMMLAAAFMFGCISAQPFATGPIKLSEVSKKNLAKYLSGEMEHRGQLGVFALSRDGRYSYWSYCRDLRCRGDDGNLVLSGCNNLSQGRSECVIYAQNGRTVWNDEDLRDRVARP